METASVQQGAACPEDAEEACEDEGIMPAIIDQAG